jgi:hypothetical protein
MAVEYFAGCACVLRAFKSLGIVPVALDTQGSGEIEVWSGIVCALQSAPRPYERDLDRSMVNILDSKGFVLAFGLAMRLRGEGFSMCGVECRTWVWLSRC